MNDLDLPPPESQPVHVTAIRISVGDWMALLTNLALAQILLALIISIPCFVVLLVWTALTSS